MMLAFFFSASGMQTIGGGARRAMHGGATASLAILLAALAVAGASGVHAARLGKDACYELRVELGFLRAAGAEEDMKLGHDWARINLTRDELENVQRLVEVEEELRFRCGRLRGRLVAKKPKVIPSPDTPMRKPALAKAKAQGSPPVATKAAALPPKKKAAKSTSRKRASLRRKRKRSKARVTSPSKAVTNGLTPYGGFQ